VCVLRGSGFSGRILRDGEFQLGTLRKGEVRGAHCENAEFSAAHCEEANFGATHCEGAEFGGACLKGTIFPAAHCEGASFLRARFNETSSFMDCFVDEHTNFCLTNLGSVKIEPEKKTFLSRSRGPSIGHDGTRCMTIILTARVLAVQYLFLKGYKHLIITI